MNGTKICSFDGCERSHSAAGYCAIHYHRNLRGLEMSPVCRFFQCGGGDVKYGFCAGHMRQIKAGEIGRQCSVQECTTSSSGKHCAMHTRRLRLNGDLHTGARNPQQDFTLDRYGYVVAVDSAHPMSYQNGRVLLHRKVLYDALGGADATCHWCGMGLEWRAPLPSRLTVDHLDADKQNNDRSNLVPSCSPCNTRRATTKAA